MKKIALVVFLILFAYPASTSALSCAEIPSIDEAYQRYDGVIVAEVLGLERKGDANEVQLRVMQSFKGIESTTLAVQENITWGALDGPSEKGESYLFFLRKQENNWENPLCSPTKKVAMAAKDLEFLKDKEISLQADPSLEEGDSSEKQELPHQPPTTLNGLALISALCLIGVIMFAIYILRKHKKES